MRQGLDTDIKEEAVIYSPYLETEVKFQPRPKYTHSAQGTLNTEHWDNATHFIRSIVSLLIFYLTFKLLVLNPLW